MVFVCKNSQSWINGRNIFVEEISLFVRKNAFRLDKNAY
jgi:hypothetical protein